MDKMNNDRQIFRTPYFTDDGRFAGFEYRRFVNGRVEWVKDEWEPWVSKQDKLTPGPDEQCTGLKDKNNNLIYENDRFRDKNGFCFTVVWKNAGFVAVIDDEFQNDTPLTQKWLKTYQIEIIGNIHEQK